MWEANSGWQPGGLLRPVFACVGLAASGWAAGRHGSDDQCADHNRKSRWPNRPLPASPGNRPRRLWGPQLMLRWHIYLWMRELRSAPKIFLMSSWWWT